MLAETAAADAREMVAAVYQAESRRVLATLIRLLGDFDLAEEALHEAFASAVEQWPREGVPANPRAWLVSAGRFRAIDTLRRRARFDASLEELANRINADAQQNAALDGEGVEDDRLRLIFTCCHPALAPEAQVALTLREVCGLTTEEIARAFLTTPSTLAQRIVRAKAKIKSAAIPYQVPSRTDLPERLDAVLHVVYLVFNEGYCGVVGRDADAGRSVGRGDSPGPADCRIAARTRSAGSVGPDAAAGVAAGCAYIARGRSDLARRSGPLALEPRADRRRPRSGAASNCLASAGSVYSSGGDRRGACRGCECRRDRLVADRRLLRRAGRDRAVAGRRAQPGGGRGDARRTCARAWL